MPLPILDPVPSGKPHDYSLRAIRSLQMTKVPTAEKIVRPEEWHNPNQKYLFHTGQGNGGTCTGQSAAYGFMHNYIRLTGDIPSPEQIQAIKRDVRDSLGSLVDIPPPHTFSPESAYQKGREVGNITYPSGGEIRFVAKAVRDYGINLESQWHSDKERKNVWDKPYETTDGGITPEKAAEFAALHRIKGWAMVGSADGFATYEEICDAIYKYGWVMAAIPIYSNMDRIQGEEIPVYPYPNGELSGFHAQCVDGYSPDALDCEHSWYGYCGQHGKIPKEYYDFAKDLCVWLVWIDEEEVKIGEAAHFTLSITCSPEATITVNNTVIGKSPQKIALEKGKTHTITASADGYVSQTKQVDDSVTELSFTLEPVGTPQPVRSWWTILLDFLKSLIALFRRN